MRNEIDQQAVIGHVALQVRVRPIGTPEHTVGERVDNASSERYYIAIRRALAIQQGAPKANPQLTVSVLNTLGNLLEGRGELDEAEKLERLALSLAEAKFGPESPQLATTCTNLADVLWNKKNLREAGTLYRRAVAIDGSLYGPDRPETAADIANLGMLMNEAGESAASVALLKQALAIYEKTLGGNSDEAKFVREHLAQAGR